MRFLEMNQSRSISGSMLVVVAFVLMLSNCDIVFDSWRETPPDSYFEQMFRSNQPDFENLVRMSDENRNVFRVSSHFTIVDGSGLSNQSGQIGFSNERWESYRAIFKKLDMEDGFTRGGDGSIRFLAFGRGLGVSGFSKGYLFSEAKMDCPWSSLDTKEPLREKAFACKKIAENWYLFVAR